ncbi:isoprenylcysteine carboxylmethyltransferase family protein [Methyloligella sp. 2.7D]|uniref:methyltransferase family protein n=1 Tax=unclassified Methyloligella TaxID=2625955 RepID=UPI00157BFDD9|nr:isoprenylcysteine carboxylmethyltransferase family protein [Methyloligella sp. GL2]QKP76070.1 hypothetical protein HT051_00520 [Methyloligella sp. GL2]
MIFDDMTRQGNRLFRYRSFLPFLIVPLAAYYFYGFISAANFESADIVVQHIGLGISLLGLALRGFTVGFTPANTSGRNTTEQKADELNTTGVYSMVRHPLYTANYIVFAGFLLPFQSLSFFLIATLAFFVYYERIAAAEEVFLEGKFGERYRSWAAKTPAFFPNPLLWKAPARGFSWRKVLRREPPGWVLVVSYFALFELMDDVVFEHEPLTAWLVREPDWAIFLALGLTLYAVSKILRKRTTLLNVS